MDIRLETNLVRDKVIVTSPDMRDLVVWGDTEEEARARVPEFLAARARSEARQRMRRRELAAEALASTRFGRMGAALARLPMIVGHKEGAERIALTRARRRKAKAGADAPFEERLLKALEALRPLSDEASFGLWEVHEEPWTASTGTVLTDHYIRTREIHGQLKAKATVVGLSTKSTSEGPRTGLWIRKEDAAFIVAAANLVRQALVGLPEPEGDYQSVVFERLMERHKNKPVEWA